MACFILAPVASEVSSRHYNRTCTEGAIPPATVPFTQRNDFAHFLRLEFALENLLFYESVTSYRDYLDRLGHGEHNQGMPFVVKATAHWWTSTSSVAIIVAYDSSQYLGATLL
jgi:hypothetical protein